MPSVSDQEKFLEYDILWVETHAYRTELLNDTVLYTIPLLWLVDRNIPFEKMQERGWEPSSNRFVMEKWQPYK